MKLFSKFSVLTFLMLFIGGIQTASAGIIFESVDDINDAGDISTLGWCSSCDGRYQAFDTFTLGSDKSVTGFSVSVYTPSGYWPNDVTFSIWTIGGINTLGVEIFNQTISHTAFDETVLNSNVSVVRTDDVVGLNLLAGSYFLSFYNPEMLAINGYSSGLGNFIQINGSDVLTEDDRLGFVLYNDAVNVPEPSTLAIFALGMIGLASRRFKKQS